jgi:hypothetical protein
MHKEIVLAAIQHHAKAAVLAPLDRPGDVTAVIEGQAHGFVNSGSAK